MSATQRSLDKIVNPNIAWNESTECPIAKCDIFRDTGHYVEKDSKQQIKEKGEEVQPADQDRAIETFHCPAFQVHVLIIRKSDLM